MDEAVTHLDRPRWIRLVGPDSECHGYDFQLVHNQPIVYRGMRSSRDRWSRPGANDVLWLFHKCGMWVAGHADKDTKEIQDVLQEPRLIWATNARRPWLEGNCVWSWVDNDASSAANAVIAPWICGMFRTSELP